MSLSKILSIGALCALAAAQPVFAADAVVTASVDQVPVYYGDLNLQTVSGAQALVARISNAAHNVCGARPMLGPGFHVAKQRRAACIKDAERTAVAKVNQPNVTAAYARRDGSVTERIATR